MNRDEIISLSASFVRCREMFALWERHKGELETKYPRISEGILTDDALIQPASIYLILGIALLYSVLEYMIDDKKMVMPETICDDLVELKPKMREFRNCVFHIQPELISPRQFAFMEASDSLERTLNILKTVDSLVFSMLEQLPDSPQSN
jgi:hypothetical protein